MRIASVKIEWDEDGCHLIIDGDSPDPEYQAAIIDWLVEDPEQLYDAVKGGILPWLMEREAAFSEFRERVAFSRDAALDAADVFRCDPDESAGAYEITDPKHPRYHSVHVDHYDNRDKT